MAWVIALVAAFLAGLIVVGAWRGRQVSIALAGAECPTCRVPLIPLRPSSPGDAGDGPRPADLAPPGVAWEVHACPRCDHLVTTVGSLPSPLADCPACRQRSLVVYAERVDGAVVVDEWCDLCGRRARTLLDRPPEHTPAPAGRVLPFRRR